MSCFCCCFGRRSANRRPGRPLGKHDVGKCKQDDLQSPLSCSSFRSEYYDAQENFSATEAVRNVEEGQFETGGVAAAVNAVSVGADGELFVDGRLAGTSETSEEALQGGGGPMSKLAGCLSILDAIRMPGSSGMPSAAAAAASPAPFGASSQVPSNGGAAEGGGGRAPPTSRRLGGKIEPGSTLRRRDMSVSVLDVREAWDECDAAAAGFDEAPSTSGRPFLVRGVDYMRTKLKVPSRGPLYRLLTADVISSETKLIHIARLVNFQHLLRPAVDPHLPPLLIITIMLPMYQPSLFGGNDGASQSLVYYFSLPPDFNPAAFSNQAALGLLRRFTTNGREADGSPTRDRFKLIPRVVNVDEWAAKGPLSPAEHKLLATYNDKPILTRPQHYYFNGPGYLEVDIDIHSYQFLARKAFSAYFDRLKEVIFENAFIMQGNSPDELPEQVLAAVRMYRINLMRSRPLKDFITPMSTGTNQSGLHGSQNAVNSKRRASLLLASDIPAHTPDG